MKKKRALLAAGAVLALCIVAIVVVRARLHDRQNKQFELLNILGDVALDGDGRDGRWSIAGSGKPMAQMDEEEIERLSRLETLPYLQGSRTAPAEKNVTVYDPAKAYEGVNLFTSGHAPAAYAIDMNGAVLHTWQFGIENIWPDVPRTVHGTFWRRAYWYPNGDLLAIFEGIGLIKLDKHSTLLWSYKGGCHHQAFVAEDGAIYVLTREARIVPRLNPEKPVLLDAVTVLNAKGRVTGQYPLLECFENSGFKNLLRGMEHEGDIFHTNSIHVFDGSMAQLSPLFKKGNALISILKLDIVAIVDLEKRQVVWAESGRSNGLWKAQHDPKPVPGGTLLIFDNCGYLDASKVFEYDMRNRRAVWVYAGDGARPLYSKTCGTAERLPNGNTLITESDNGRVLEVTPRKEIVWEFYNPHRAGEHNELIATVFDMVRVDKEYLQWIKNDAAH